MTKIFLAALVAGASAQSFSFNKSMYHNELIGTPTGDPFKAREIIFIDGDFDVSKGGTAKMSSGNGTFDDTDAAFSMQYKSSLMSSEWEANVTAKVGGKDLNMRAMFFGYQPGQPQQCIELEIFADAGLTHIAGFLQRGPNPQPRPPSPGPGPRPPTPAPSTCYNEYAQSDCDKLSACKWCSSGDGNHHLCYSADAALDKTKWTCSKSRGGLATPHAVPAAAGKCAAQQYPGVTYDTKLAAKTSAAASADACCSACFADKACDHWSYNPEADAAQPCHSYSAVQSRAQAYVFHASAATFSGSGAAQPPSPFPPSPTPAPAPTPPPSPPPAPTPPTPSPEGAQNWAVIVVGSQGFGNYRHHADGCHAYKIVRENGIPAERVILMMQDNVANAPQNPYPGQLFNKPTAAGTPGVDVYDGCAPDYTGSIVDKQLFLDVLTGNTSGNATKVLKSGPKDKVFVNFADHGGGQLIAMPNGAYLKAPELNDALKTMHSKKMYEKLVFYMEACNSGSMFEGLLDKGLNIYATTAANPSEPSWGTYCPPQDMVDGKSVGSCLGDLYSVNWMEDSDTKAGLAERLGDQFVKVKAETNKSHCMEYGDQTFKWSDHAVDYQGEGASAKAAAAAAAQEEPAAPATPKDAVDSRDIDLVVAFYAYLRATCPMKKSAAAEALAALVEAREAADARFGALLGALPKGGALRADRRDVQACQHMVVDTAEAHCGAFDSYSLKFTKPLVDACLTHSHDEIHAQLLKACASA
eukprot:g3583.t1